MEPIVHCLRTLPENPYLFLKINFMTHSLSYRVYVGIICLKVITFSRTLWRLRPPSPPPDIAGRSSEAVALP